MRTRIKITHLSKNFLIALTSQTDSILTCSELCTRVYSMYLANTDTVVRKKVNTSERFFLVVVINDGSECILDSGGNVLDLVDDSDVVIMRSSTSTVTVTVPSALSTTTSSSSSSTSNNTPLKHIQNTIQNNYSNLSSTLRTLTYPIANTNYTPKELDFYIKSLAFAASYDIEIVDDLVCFWKSTIDTVCDDWEKGLHHLILLFNNIAVENKSEDMKIKVIVLNGMEELITKVKLKSTCTSRGKVIDDICRVNGLVELVCSCVSNDSDSDSNVKDAALSLLSSLTSNTSINNSNTSSISKTINVNCIHILLNACTSTMAINTINTIGTTTLEFTVNTLLSLTELSFGLTTTSKQTQKQKQKQTLQTQSMRLSYLQDLKYYDVIGLLISVCNVIMNDREMRFMDCHADRVVIRDLVKKRQRKRDGDNYYDGDGDGDNDVSESPELKFILTHGSAMSNTPQSLTALSLSLDKIMLRITQILNRICSTDGGGNVGRSLVLESFSSEDNGDAINILKRLCYHPKLFGEFEIDRTVVNMEGGLTLISGLNENGDNFEERDDSNGKNEDEDEWIKNSFTYNFNGTTSSFPSTSKSTPRTNNANEFDKITPKHPRIMHVVCLRACAGSVLNLLAANFGFDVFDRASATSRGGGGRFGNSGSDVSDHDDDDDDDQFNDSSQIEIEYEFNVKDCIALMKGGGVGGGIVGCGRLEFLLRSDSNDDDDESSYDSDNPEQTQTPRKPQKEHHYHNRFDANLQEVVKQTLHLISSSGLKCLHSSLTLLSTLSLSNNTSKSLILEQKGVNAVIAVLAGCVFDGSVGEDLVLEEYGAMRVVYEGDESNGSSHRGVDGMEFVKKTKRLVKAVSRECCRVLLNLCSYNYENNNTNRGSNSKDLSQSQVKAIVKQLEDAGIYGPEDVESDMGQEYLEFVFGSSRE